MRPAMRKDSFERFYFEKIALAEGCGCAEHVTRMRDIDELLARRPFEVARPWTVPFGWAAPAMARLRGALVRVARIGPWRRAGSHETPLPVRAP